MRILPEDVDIEAGSSDVVGRFYRTMGGKGSDNRALLDTVNSDIGKEVRGQFPGTGVSFLSMRTPIGRLIFQSFTREKRALDDQH